MFNKSPSINGSFAIVKGFFDKKMLAELGYTQDAKDLESWEVEAFSVIQNQVNKCLDEKRKKDERTGKTRKR